jgi:glutathione S-transferase
MLLKIWGREDSLSVQKVMWCVRELGIPYEQINMGKGYGRLDQPWYLKMNPTATIPTIDDDGFILWESNAIVRYLAAKHSAGTLMPEDLRQRADSDRWMDWTSVMLQPLITPVFWGLIRTPAEKRNMAAIEADADLTVAAAGWVVWEAGLKCCTSLTANNAAWLPSTLRRVSEQLPAIMRYHCQRFSGRYQDNAAEITPL